MYEIFGEFDSYEEINKKAAELKAAGNQHELRTLARENGLDEEDAQDFYSGAIEELTTPILAAMGKIEVEAKGIEIFGVFTDWKGEILSMCQQDADFAKEVRRKGKTLIECFAAVIEAESKKRKNVDKKITKLINGCPENLPMSTMTKKEQIEVIRRYYGK